MSSTAGNVDTHAFQAETKRLLDIVIHSLYSNKEIFLRELISNSSDALDRLRFEALTDTGVMEDGEILEIRIDLDADERTLTISDNGIGMSRDEVTSNLGTIAKSGTREALHQLEDADSSPESMAQLIGQFGVGFYSSFMVADRVTVVTRRAGEPTATRWQSTGDGEFEIGDDSRFLRGTTVTLHLKDADEDAGLADFAQLHNVEEIVKKYSDFIPYPIRTKRPKDDDVEEITLNSMRPIWTRAADEVDDDEYAEFYRHIAHDWSAPLDRLSLQAEGRIEYQALLFLPERAPFDLFWRDQQTGLQLYVRRILIQDRCEELLPSYLRFVKGVVDSADLQLNVSREMLQQDRHILQMRKWITRKVLDHLVQMKKDDGERYLRFWTEFGKVLKEGVAGDEENRKRLVPLLLFESSRDETLTDLDSYAQRMPEEQADIYYLTGENRAVVEGSPHLEGLREAGTEVLYMIDPIDEFMLQGLPEHADKKLRSAAEGSIDLPSAGEEASEGDDEDTEKPDYADLLTALKERLGDLVREVRISKRLRSSPSCLVTEEGDMSPQLERLLRQTDAAATIPQTTRILELNDRHPVVGQLQQRFADDPQDVLLDDYAQLLHSYALIAEGSEIPEPARFNQLLSDLMTRGLGATGT